MPRKARVLVPSCPHHVVQRGHNKSTVFAAAEDYAYYIENLVEFKSALGVRVYAWCLMTNHIHLLVEPGEEPEVLSEMMSRVNGRQTRFVNKLEGRTGSLWEGRFKASPVQSDTYLLACCRYIELNPVRAGMVEHVADYPWSSFSERMSGDLFLLDNQSLEATSGHACTNRFFEYQKFVEGAVSDVENRFLRESFQRNQLTGNTRFVDEIEKKIGLRIERRAQGRPKK